MQSIPRVNQIFHKHSILRLFNFLMPNNAVYSQLFNEQSTTMEEECYTTVYLHRQERIGRTTLLVNLGVIVIHLKILFRILIIILLVNNVDWLRIHISWCRHQEGLKNVSNLLDVRNEDQDLSCNEYCIK